MLVQAGAQANQLTSATDRAGNITNLPKIGQGFFFSQDSKETCTLIFVSVLKNVYQGNIPSMKTIHTMYVFFKDMIGKTNCYWHVRFFFDLF